MKDKIDDLRLTLRLNDETKGKLKNFINSLNSLPKELYMDVSNEWENTPTDIKINLKDIIIDQVEKHFED